VPGGLPGDAEGNSDPVPAPPAGSGSRHSLGDQRLIPPDLIGCLGDSAQVRQIIGGNDCRVKGVGEPLETAGRPLDFGACASCDHLL
jgi:hypothetical protein